jgi:hypothetical protein
LASVHVPVFKTATGVVSLDGEAHFEVSICMRLCYVVEGLCYICVGGSDVGSGVRW